MLQGMADEKNTFASTAGELKDRYYVIIPDQQGNGENELDSSREYSIRSHVEFLDAIVNKLSLESFALGGNSMVGRVSAAYTLAHPNKVTKLFLVNAPGLKLDEHVLYGGFGGAMQSREDF